MTFDFELDRRSYLKRRESYDLEYKQSFQGGDNLIKYAKSLVGMANHKGGQIIFGIQNSPHIPLGISTKKWNEIDPLKIDRIIREYFSHEIEWSQNILIFDNKEFGQISVNECSSKPIICMKNKEGLLREGAIYYRYRGETTEIKSAELQLILNKEKEKEKLLWMQHIQKIAQIGVKNVSLFDTYKGEINVGEGKILLDEKILDKINFIKEGKFTERDGEGVPTLKLIGNIEGISESEIIVETDKIFPLFTKDLQNKLSLNGHQIKTIIWKLKIKGNPKYHTAIRSGNNSNFIHKYAESLIPVISRMLTRPLFLEQCSKEYTQYQKDKLRIKRLNRK